jgi:hypothetical protein
MDFAVLTTRSGETRATICGTIELRVLNGDEHSDVRPDEQ